MFNPLKNTYSAAKNAVCGVWWSYFALVLLSLPLGTISQAQQPDLVFVQLPETAAEYAGEEISIFPPYDVQLKGARILLLRKSGEAVSLTTGFYAACDPDVSFDGTEIIFSGKKTAQDRWQIWRLSLDGGEFARIARCAEDCFSPVYAGNRFYLDDPQPTPQIIFSSVVPGWSNDIEKGPVSALFATDPDGETVRRITFNIYSDFSPDVLADGRLVYTSMQPHGAGMLTGEKFALFAVNNDGTDVMPYYGNHELPRYKDMVHVSEFDQRIYFIESDRAARLGGGAIASLSTRRPLHSYRKVSAGKDRYLYPCPLPGGGLIASFRGDNAPYGLYLIDPETGKRRKRLYYEAGWHSLDAQVVTNRRRVKGRSNWLIPGSTSGVLYCMDCYRTNLTDMPNPARGTIKYLKVVAGMTVQENRGARGPQVLGYAPVEDDGSFHIRVPAETPVAFQLLDVYYNIVREQKTWIWVMGNENRGCIGCHEDREMSPPNKMVTAVTKPAVDLTLPEEKRGREPK